MSFNPANFPFTMPALPVATAADPSGEAIQCAEELHAAACRFEARGLGDQFARKSAMAARDIAAKLVRFGSFASDTQREYAAKLVTWSKPRVQAAAAPVVAVQPTELPRLYALMQRLAKLEIGKLRIQRENGGSRCWIRHVDADKAVGKIDAGVLTQWQRPGVDHVEVLLALLTIEADPEAAAVLHGKASGRCSVCSRDLTNPESIARGIGPICAEKF